MEGLRTLVITQKLLSEDQYTDFQAKLDHAKASLDENRHL